MGIAILAGIAVLAYVASRGSDAQSAPTSGAAIAQTTGAPTNTAIQGAPIQVLGNGPAGVTSSNGVTRPAVPTLGPVVSHLIMVTKPVAIAPPARQLPPAPNRFGNRGRYFAD